MLYDVEFSYKIPEWGNVELDATDIDEAETLACQYVRESFPDAVDVEITGVKEIKEGE